MELKYQLWKLLGPRNQFSDTTAYLDGSVIYGHSDDKIRTLRVVQIDNPHGYLTTFNSEDGRPLLPVSTNLADGCNKPDEVAKGQFCFASGKMLFRTNANCPLSLLYENSNDCVKNFDCFLYRRRPLEREHRFDFHALIMGSTA